MNKTPGKSAEVRKVRTKKRALTLSTQARGGSSAKATTPAAALAGELVELFPHGISVGSDVGRPVLILKDQHAIEVLPVWIQPLDAGVALAELSQSTGATPHAVTRRLLERLELKLESCTFDELLGHHQFVTLNFVGPLAEKSDGVRLRVRADEAMSFCLQGRAKFYASKAFMLSCRSLDADLSTLEQNLLGGQLPQLEAELMTNSKKHPYMM